MCKGDEEGKLERGKDQVKQQQSRSKGKGTFGSRKGNRCFTDWGTNSRDGDGRHS